MPKLQPVSPYVIEFVLILGHLLVDQDSVLAALVGLAKLDAWD